MIDHLVPQGQLKYEEMERMLEDSWQSATSEHFSVIWLGKCIRGIPKYSFSDLSTT